MTMMTGQQYRESLRRLKPEIYYMGEKIESVADHPAFLPHVTSNSSSSSSLETNRPG